MAKSLLPLPFFKKQAVTEQVIDPKIQKEEKIKEKIREFSRGLVTIQDIIAPEAIEVDFTYQKINSTFKISLAGLGNTLNHASAPLSVTLLILTALAYTTTVSYFITPQISCFTI